jgi:glycosyltransferase involved in cell wall biosynthesis
LPADSLRAGTGAGRYLAFLGRTSPEKGLDQAIEIAKRAAMPLKIAAKIDPADVQYFDRVIRPLLKHPLIEFIGEIGHGEKNAFLGNAAAVLFPINWSEPFGLVMIEAMACGTPVIAFPRGSVPEVQKQGVTGFVVPDMEGAVDALTRLHEIDRQSCRRHFEEHFTVERMARDYLSLYRSLVGGERSTIAVPDEGVLSWSKLASRSSTT